VATILIIFLESTNQIQCMQYKQQRQTKATEEI